jgi:hypothetical protein
MSWTFFGSENFKNLKHKECHWSGEHEKPNWGILELEYNVERKSRVRLFIKS